MISVCIATYNGEGYIKEQISSILSQLKPEDEVIISDDMSSDHTLLVIESEASPLIKIVHNKGAHGYTPNFENALRHASGDIIFLSDQDDVWAPNKVQCMVEYLQHFDLVISDADIIDGNGDVVAESYFKERGSKKGFINNLIRFSFLGCSMAFRKDILNHAMPFPQNHSLCTHDNWLGIVGMAYYHTIVIDDKLFHYRRHQTNASKGGLQPTTTFWFKCKYRLYLMWWLIRRMRVKRQ